MNTILLLGVDWTQDGSLNPHFWSRAILGGAAVLVGLWVFDRLMAALTRSRWYAAGGSGGGRLRIVPREFVGDGMGHPRALPTTHRRDEHPAHCHATDVVRHRTRVTVCPWNGGSSVTDTNGKKPIPVRSFYARPRWIMARLVYRGEAAGARSALVKGSWRTHFDPPITTTASPTESDRAHGDSVFEPRSFGHATGVAETRSAPVVEN